MIISHDAGFLNHACTEPRLSCPLEAGCLDRSCVLLEVTGSCLMSFMLYLLSYCIPYHPMFTYEWSRTRFVFAQDIVHFTKQGRLEYYEGNFDAFRCSGFTGPPCLDAMIMHRLAGKRPNWMLKVRKMWGSPGHRKLLRYIRCQYIVLPEHCWTCKLRIFRNSPNLKIEAT